MNKRGLQKFPSRLAALAIVLCATFLTAQVDAQSAPAATVSDAGATNPFYSDAGAARRPLEFGALVQGGNGVTDNRGGFHFLMAGVHGGKVLTGNMGPGLLHGNFEYAVEVFPFWQSYTPRFERNRCISPAPGSVTCGPVYTVGGTFSGVTVTPIILRWNFSGTRRMAFWAQGAGGVLWTNHKYPAFGGPVGSSLANNGPNTDASVWNFTPQGGVGLHYFLKPRRSIDLGANAVHISSASLGDKNPGVNASVQLTLGYSWWK